MSSSTCFWSSRWSSSPLRGISQCTCSVRRPHVCLGALSGTDSTQLEFRAKCITDNPRPSDNVKTSWSTRKQVLTSGDDSRFFKMEPGDFQRGAVADQILKDKAPTIFRSICANPRALSSETIEFMLTVAESNSLLTIDEALDASNADLVMKGVYPTDFHPVLLVCATTMFPACLELEDVEKAERRARLWEKAVGPKFFVVAVAAGYKLQPEVAEIAEEHQVICCDFSNL